MTRTLEMTRIVSAAPPPPVVRYDGWRLSHQHENGVVNDELVNGMPEIYPSDWGNGVAFSADLQRLSYDLMKHFNPFITAAKWRVVYRHDVAFTNYQGFDKPGDPRADFVNGRDIGAELPKLMKVTLCGGSFYRGIAMGDRLWMSPGVHGIDANKAIPDVFTVIENNWYFYAVTWHNGDKINHFPQGWDGADYYGPVVIPIVLSEPVSYPLRWFSRWQSATLPDPLKYGG